MSTNLRFSPVPVVRQRRASASGLLSAGRHVALWAAIGLSALLALDLVVGAVGEGWLGFDFRGTLWQPAMAVLEGRSPYPRLVASEVGVGNPALYPPLSFVLVAPLSVLPWWLGVALWVVALVAAITGTLYVLGVRDWKCYAVAAISLPVVTGTVWGNVTVLLVLLVALAWRLRQRWIWAGVLVGLAIAAKLFLWPLIVWLAGTRRYRAAAWAAVVTLMAIFVPWAAIGFDGLTTYPDLLRLAEELYAVHGYSVATMASALGAEPRLATWLAVAAGATLSCLAFAAGRRGYDEVAMSLVIVAAVIGSPIVWEYYYALLIVPLALVWPRFAAAWLLLLALYLTHRLPRPKLPARELEPGGSACCKPDGVPGASWVFNHAPPGLWPALGHALVALTIVAMAWVVVSRQHRSRVEPARSAS